MKYYSQLNREDNKMFYIIIIIQLLIAIFNLAMGYHLKDKMIVCLSVLITLLSLLYTVEYLNILAFLKI